MGFVFHQGVTFLAAGLLGVDGRIKFIDGDVYAAFFAACPVTLDTILIGISRLSLGIGSSRLSKYKDGDDY